MKEKEIIRTSEQACRELEVITALMNVKVTQTKYTQQGVGQHKEMVPTGSFEYSPFGEKELTYLKAMCMVLASKFIDKEELVQFAKPQQQSEVLQSKESSNDLAESKSVTEEVKEQPDSKAVE